MGAVLGLISKIEISDENYDNKKEVFKKYKFDSIEHIQMKNIKFSCFQQKITKESVDEILPFYDEKSNCVITSDAILDNRDDLIKKLKILNTNISDSEIILQAYIKWGQEYPKYLLGDFVVAIYDFEKSALIMARDQLGNKMIYYTLDENEFTFSTLLGSFQNNIDKNHIKTFFASRMIMNNSDKKATILTSCKILPPAHTLVYMNQKVKLHKYWSLKKYEKIKSYDEGIKKFIDVYTNAVNCRLRTDGEVGVMVSGGLDSASVACLAAQNLLKKNKNLNMYTSIISNEFHVIHDPIFIVDESSLVVEMKKKYPNMIINFLDCKEVNSYNIIDTILDVLEEPVKFIENSYWLNEIIKTASQDGCKVILDGQSGNTTVSYGSISKYLFFYIRKLKIIKFKNAFLKLASDYNIGRKKLLRFLFDELFLNKNKDLDFISEYSLLNKTEIKKLEKVLKNNKKSKKVFSSIRSVLDNVLDPIVLNQFSAADTKFGLKYNVVKRDPTRDVRVLECLYQFDIRMFNHEGHGRTLIRHGMKGIVPDSILENHRVGLQSADFMHRLENSYEEITNELKIALERDDFLENYIDKNIFLNYLNKNSLIDVNTNLIEKVKMRDFLSAIYCVRYLDKNSGNRIM